MSTRPLFIASNTEIVKKEVSMPELAPNEVLIKVRAIGFNSADAKQLDVGLASNSGLGCDFSGDVVKIGSAVTEVKLGETVAGVVYGGNDESPDDGAFSTYVKTPEDCVIKFAQPLVSSTENSIPAGIPTTYEQAASLPVSAVIAALGFEGHCKQDITVKGSSMGYAVVSGATTSVGYIAVQVLKYVGYGVIVIVAPQYKPLFNAIGVALDFIIDDKDPNMEKKVKDIAGDNITSIFDAISLPQTLSKLIGLVSKTKAVNVQYTIPDCPLPEAGPNVKFVSPLASEVLVSAKNADGSEPQVDKRFVEERKIYIGHINQLTTNNVLHALPIEVVGDGLDAVPVGLERVRENVTGVKIVVRL